MLQNYHWGGGCQLGDTPNIDNSALHCIVYTYKQSTNANAPLAWVLTFV